ncbi:MAG: hypothetical protein KKA59_03840, partial [Candidatus Omnitrophica bacterium]|nr:hypothetical protein [Candidatus Omnitrophota bacterium]
VTLIVIPLFKYFNKRKNIPMIVICALLNTIYQNFLIVIWVYMVFNTFLSKTTDNNWIPLLIWSYGVAMGPLAYMARGEDKDSIGTNIGIFLAILTWFTLAFMYLFTGISLIPLRILWIGAALFQTYLVTAMQIAENKEQND